MRHTILGLAALALVLGGVRQTSAGYIQLTDASMLSAGDTSAIYTGNDGDTEATPYVVPAVPNALTFGKFDGRSFLRADQGNTWQGAFPDSTKLLWTLDQATTTYSSVSIGSALPVTEIGLSVQQDNPVPTTFTATAYFGLTPELTITVTDPASGPGPGSLAFLGFKATGGDVITGITISSADSADTTFNNDFAMGPVSFGFASKTPVPEPSTLGLACAGALGLAAFGWRRRKA